jgi:anti-sigma factor RsiW
MSEHVREALGAYVLGALDPEETAAVKAHLHGCPSCAAEHAGLAALPPLLGLAEEAGEHAPPSPAVEERVLDAFAREHRPARRSHPARPRRSWRLPLGAGIAGAAAAAALAIALLGGGGAPAGQPADWGVALRGTSAAPGARARAELTAVSGGTVMHLWARHLAPGARYEVRCGRAEAGSFRADRHGRAAVILTTAARQGDYEWIHVFRYHRGAEQPVMTGRLT